MVGPTGILSDIWEVRPMPCSLAVLGHDKRVVGAARWSFPGPTHLDSAAVAIHCAQPIRRPDPPPPPPPPAAAAARSCFPIKTRGRQRRFSRPDDEMSGFLNAVKWRQEGKRFDPRAFFLVADVLFCCCFFLDKNKRENRKVKKKK